MPALAQESLFGTAGAIEHANTGVLNQQNRGALSMRGIAYFVNGDALYRLNRVVNIGLPVKFTTTSLGTIEGTGRVSMATNGTQLFIMVPGGKGSIWVQNTTTFTPDIDAIDPDFTANGNPQYVVFVDGYFLLTTDTRKFIISGLNDGLAYNALDFGTAEADPDDIVAPIVYKNQVFIMGTDGAEVFQNQPAGAGFPFQRIEGFILDKGLSSPFSLILGDNTFRYVGSGVNESPSIYELQGNKVVKISNTAIDSVLQDLTDTEISNIFAGHYGFNGQYFTHFTLPSEVFEYNSISQRWHQRRSSIGGGLDAWRASSLVTAYGKLWIGDRIDGRIGELNEDTYTEYGETIYRQVDTMPFAANGNSFRVSSLELTVESGVGDFTTTNPLMRMSRSIDSKTITDELTKSMGKIGEYTKRQIWKRLGRVARFEMFRFVMTDPVKPVIIKLQARISAGTR